MKKCDVRSIYYLQQRINVTQNVPHLSFSLVFYFLFKSLITQFTKRRSFARHLNST